MFCCMLPAITTASFAHFIDHCKLDAQLCATGSVAVVATVTAGV